MRCIICEKEYNQVFVHKNNTPTDKLQANHCGEITIRFDFGSLYIRIGPAKI